MNPSPDPNIVSTTHGLYFTENRRDEALRLLEAEAARFPDSQEVIDFLSFLYASEGRYLDALRLLNRLVEIHPTPRCMSNIVFCRTRAAACVLDGQPINGATQR